MIPDQYKSLLVFVASTLGVSLLGKAITEHTKDPWYNTLTKSNFTPPGWVFGVVWPLLYLCMAVAVWHAYQDTRNAQRLVRVYFAHLLVNLSWTFVFFGLHSPLGGLLIIPVLIFFILWLMRLYYPKHLISFYLMVPYLGWCCFAFFLNFQIVLYN